MKVKKVGYVVIIILAFVLGMQMDINFETSQIVNSDDIAIVNNDQRVDYMDQSIKFGDEIIKQFEYVDSNYNYTVVSSAEASQGLVSGKYAAVITIPSNLTTSILSINTDAPISTTINYELNSRLTNKSKEKLEAELNTGLNTSQNNLTYMYVYSIFDSLHDTQEGIEVVTENDQPVYEFLEELLEINVVTNHEYELEENNSDSFSIINLSEQLTEFNQIITSYKQEIQSVVNLYKIENDESSQIINAQISKYEDNTEGLNNNIDNVEDTLQTLVNNNEDYAKDEFSITDTRADIQKILVRYYSQLIELNDMNATNEKLIADSQQFKDLYDDLNERAPYEFYNQLLDYRNEYYNQVSVVDQCLSTDNLDTCLDGSIDSFANEYFEYETLLNNFEQEKQYGQTLSYYINHIGTEEVRSDESSEILSIDTEFESVISDDIEEDDIEPIIAVSKYQTIGYNDDYILLTIDNIKSGIDSVTIDITKTNVASIESVNVSDENLMMTNGSISLDDMDPTRYNYLLKITKEDPTEEAQVTFSYGEQSTAITTPVADLNLDSTYTYNYAKQKLVIDYQYLVETTDVLTYVNTGLFSYIDTASIINQSEADIVTLTNSGFTIDPSVLESGTELSFSIELNLNSKLGNGIFIDEYSINDIEYQSPFIVEDKESTINTSITIDDDPYYVDAASGDIDNPDNDLEVGDSTIETDDYVANKTLEPGEEVGVKYTVEYKTDTQSNINKLQFDLVTSELANQLTGENIIGVEFNRDNINYRTSVTDDLITIEPSDPTTVEIGEDGKYTYKFEIYLNTQVKSDITVESEDERLVVSNNQVNIVTDSYQSEYDNYESDGIDLSWGAIEPIITYTVDEDTCEVNAKKLADCQFEAGETVDRQIRITNNSDKPAAGIKITEAFDKSIIDYESGSEYKLVGTKGEIKLSDTVANSYIESYSDTETNGEAANVMEINQVSLPAYSTLTITNSLEVDENILEQEDVEITQVITQYGTNDKTASKTINILPIVLKLSDLEAEQIVNDGIITADEGLKLSFKMTNGSSRGISQYNNVVLSNSLEGIIDKVEVVSVEDEDWRDVDYTTNISGDTLEINVDKQLEPKESVQIEVKVLFNNLSGASGNGLIVIQSFRDTAEKSDSSAEDNTELSYEYSLSKANYLELAKYHLENHETVPGEKYIDSYQESSQTVNDRDLLNATISKLNGYIFKYDDYFKRIDSYTTLNNKEIKTIKIKLSMFGLGYENKDDEDYIATYDYCIENDELSCKIINLYNKIYTIEDQDKEYFGTLLNTLNPSIEETIGTKIDNDGNETDKPTNIGADFNGTNTCEEIESEVDSEIASELIPQSDDCIDADPGIWNRIDVQKQDVDLLEEDIDLILDNEVQEVEEEPYKESLGKNSDEMNKTMDDVESENNQLFDTKINIYNDNYSAVLEYLQEVTEDESYIEAVDEFKEDEDARQVVTNEILTHTYELMPNTYLNGMPNKLVYSFIAEPLNIESSTESNVLTTTANNELNMLYFYLLGFLTLFTAALAAIFYKISKGV